MSEALEKKKSLKDAAIEIWSNVNEIRKLFAANLDEREFTFFMTLGKGLGANPFKREIWAVKYDASKPASIFCGRDFYRRKAQEQEDYNGHVTDAVYTNDQFQVINGIPQHTYSLVDRGELIGAYTAVYRKSIDKPFFVFVKLSEYDKGFSLWKTMKETLIKKVSEAQGLRGAYQGIFAGTYDESEQWVADKNNKGNAAPAPVKDNPATAQQPADSQEQPADDDKQMLFEKLRALCLGDQQKMVAQLKRLTAYDSKKTGKHSDGKTSFDAVSPMEAKIALKKLNEELEADDQKVTE